MAADNMSVVARCQANNSLGVVQLVLRLLSVCLSFSKTRDNTGQWERRTSADWYRGRAASWR
jgi:hypothetical protein